MSDSLSDVIKKLKEQNSQATETPAPAPRGRPPLTARQPVNIQAPAPAVALPSPEELEAMENEDGDIENDFEADPEDTGNVPTKQASQKPQESIKTPIKADDSQKVAGLLRDLQDNGIYRLRSLALQESISDSLKSIDKTFKQIAEVLALQYVK